MGAAKGKAGGCHVSVAQRPASWGSRLGAGLNGGGGEKATDMALEWASFRNPRTAELDGS